MASNIGNIARQRSIYHAIQSGFISAEKAPANIHADVRRDDDNDDDGDDDDGDDDDDHAERLSSGSLCRKNVFSLERCAMNQKIFLLAKCI